MIDPSLHYLLLGPIQQGSFPLKVVGKFPFLAILIHNKPQNILVDETVREQSAENDIQM
jgi:hypothetical protein